MSFAGGVRYEGVSPPARLARLGFFDPAHLPILLAAHVGDVILLPSDLYRESVIYQVQEVYKPASLRTHKLSAPTP